jgi:hypothetical protein
MAWCSVKEQKQLYLYLCHSILKQRTKREYERKYKNENRITNVSQKRCGDRMHIEVKIEADTGIEFGPDNEHGIGYEGSNENTLVECMRP